MHAFWGLIKKDLAITRFWYLVWLVLLFLGMIASFVLVERINEPSSLVPIYILAISAQIVLMPILMLFALKIEGKSQMWLYNPQSSTKLLLAKLTSMFLMQVLSQFFLIIYGVVILNYLLRAEVISTSEKFLPINLIFLFHLGIIGTAVYLAIWILFYWTVYHSLGKYPHIRSFRWLIIMIMWFSFNTIEAIFHFILGKSNLFPSLTIEINTVPSMDYVSGSGWEIVKRDGDFSFPILAICIYTVIAIALFLISSRLLDKKVEV
ncbi:hypothetical protein [Bacillus niameyensis]|uniref:hypothetical protein n=1 Tax=Bacillus niameyensis TaxID=1522308 RepID=UPI000785BAD5|nr:hypothetical protein [Bacillus niameyensis]